MSAHTPGPWRIEHSSMPGTLDVVSGTHQATQLVACLFPYNPMARGNYAHAQEANAALIEAAPDLLAALELLVHRVENPLAFGDEEALAHRMSKARVAIIKARGQAIGALLAESQR